MGAQTLERLYELGLSPSAEVQLDFFFAAPNKDSGQALVAHLQENDCLDVSMAKAGGFFSRQYLVRGKTYPTAVTTEVLAHWIPWMVVQGVLHNCDFDGWGTEV